jgi:hypothetical protein
MKEKTLVRPTPRQELPVRAKAGCVFLLSVLLSLGAWLGLRPTVGAEPAPTRCQDPLSRSPNARFCVKHKLGHTRFQVSMSSPTTIYSLVGTKDAGQEIIVFDHWIVVSKHAGSERTIVPRDRFVFSTETEFPDK